MILLFELSKEQHALPGAEVLACLDTEAVSYKPLVATEDVLVVDTPADKKLVAALARRLAFTFVIDDLLFSCPATLQNLVEQARRHPLARQGSVAIRCKCRGSTFVSADVIDHLGSVYTKGRKVDLTSPDIEIRVLLTEKTVYVGIKKTEVDTGQFQGRRGHLRPFLSPITMHPKIARALVNLSSVKMNEVLLDPFCGTGGILIEAGLLGIQVIGGDVEKKMIDGCRENLLFYHLDTSRLFHEDIGRIHTHVDSVDAVVTDFPYAKATTTKGEDPVILYDRSFKVISGLLNKGGSAVIGLPTREMISVGKKYLSFINVFPIRAHRSLTRYFVVYRKE